MAAIEEAIEMVKEYDGELGKILDGLPKFFDASLPPEALAGYTAVKNHPGQGMLLINPNTDRLPIGLDWFSVMVHEGFHAQEDKLGKLLPLGSTAAQRVEAENRAYTKQADAVNWLFNLTGVLMPGLDSMLLDLLEAGEEIKADFFGDYTARYLAQDNRNA